MIKTEALKLRLVTAGTRLLSHVRGPAPRIPDEPARVLILKPCCLGDVLLTTPLVHALRLRFPHAELTYAVGRWSQPIVATSADIDRVWTIPDRWSPGTLTAMVRALRQRHFDMVFVPDRSPLQSGLVVAAGIPVRIGLDNLGRGWGYTHPVAVPPGVIHEADLYSMLGIPVGLTSIPRRLHFSVPPHAAAEALQLRSDLAPSRSGPLVVLHAGGGVNPGMTLPRKRWLPERWAAIADRLVQERAATVLLVGGPDDQAAVEAVQTRMCAAASTCVRAWSWSVLAAFLQMADLFLGHDTGMMHLAAAVDTPTLAVFGPSDPQMYGPYSPFGRYVWHPTCESPCFFNGLAPADCPCAGQCMSNVSLDEVWANIEQLLVPEPRAAPT